MTIKIIKTGKKAQLKIQQMSFMLIAVIILFAIIALFYFTISFSGLNQTKINLDREKAAEIAVKIASTPEFIFNGMPNSIDADKLMILKSEEKYNDFWGVNGIIIQKIYPAGENIECKLSNYPDCSTIKLFTSKNLAPEKAFVSLCRKQEINGRPYDKCEMAVIMIDAGNK